MPAVQIPGAGGGATSSGHPDTGTYSANDLVAAAQAAGWSLADARLAAAISLAEVQDRNASAHNTVRNNYGAWQINGVHTAILASGNWKNIGDNAKMAHQVWAERGGGENGWKAWTMYRNGKYKTNLPFVSGAPGSSQGGGTGSSGGLAPGILDPGGAASQVAAKVLDIPGAIKAAADSFTTQAAKMGGQTVAVVVAVVLLGLGVAILLGKPAMAVAAVATPVGKIAKVAS